MTMLKRIAAYAAGAMALVHAAEAQPPRNIKKGVIDAAIPNAASAVTLSVATGTGPITPTQAANKIDVSGGTTLTVNNIVLGTIWQEGDSFKVSSISGETITFSHGAGNITTETGADVQIANGESAEVNVGAAGAVRVLKKGAGGDAALASFDTKALAAASTASAQVKVIETRGYAAAGDGGGARYERLASCPGTLKVWHIQTANNICFVLDMRNVTLEMFGAVGDGATYNNTAFAAVTEAISTSSLRIKKVSANGPTATYYIWPTSASAGSEFILDGVSNLEFDGRGAVFSARHTDSGVSRNLFLLRNGACDNKIYGIVGQEPNFTSSGTNGGMNWFHEQTGACRNSFEGVFTGGLQGHVADTDGVTMTPRVFRSDVKITSTDVYYPIGWQAQCDDCKARLRSTNPGRPYIFYNVRNADVYSEVVGDRRSHPMIVCYGNNLTGAINETVGFKVKDVELNQSYGATKVPLYLSQQQWGGSHLSSNDACRIAGEVELVRNEAATGEDMLLATQSYSNQSSVHSPGDVAGNVIDVTIRGRIKGNVASDAFQLCSNTAEFTSNTACRFSIIDFEAKDVTRAIKVGQWTSVQMTNSDMRQATVTLQGGTSYAGYYGQKNAKTSTYKGDVTYQNDTNAPGLILDGSTSYTHLQLRRQGAIRADFIADEAAAYLRGPPGGQIQIWPQGSGGGSSESFNFFNTKLEPSTTNAISLGSSSKNWLDVFLKGTLTIENTQQPASFLLSGTASSPNTDWNFKCTGMGGGWTGRCLFQTNSSGGAYTDQFLISNVAGSPETRVLAGKFAIDTTQTPASASATCATGQIAWDTDFIYVCTGTNTWKRAAIATW